MAYYVRITIEKDETKPTTVRADDRYGKGMNAEGSSRREVLNAKADAEDIEKLAKKIQAFVSTVD